jgi:hypothetical protein
VAVVVVVIRHLVAAVAVQVVIARLPALQVATQLQNLH